MKYLNEGRFELKDFENYNYLYFSQFHSFYY